MRTSDFDFDLPEELIAQAPAAERDSSRLLVIDRASGTRSHTEFRRLPDHLREGDVLVLNNSKVMPARLRGANLKTGGRFEVFLLWPERVNAWWTMLRPGKRAREGTVIDLLDRSGKACGVQATVREINEDGHRRLEFAGVPDVSAILEGIGETPLPPYIRRPGGATAEDRARYQTVFAGPAGSVAAPTAGLHFTPGTLETLRKKGVNVCMVTLHVGPGTFAPVKAERVTAHRMHREWFEVPADAAEHVNSARAERRRVIAVGTTSLRVLESAVEPGSGRLKAGPGSTDIFIYPPYSFLMADGLLTNFHLPRSTLLMLVSAFAAPGRLTGKDVILEAYGEAITRRYRFFSYGDAMLIL